MAQQGPNADRRGSLWHRWDPHIHAPGTLLSDHFNGDDEAFLLRIERSSPAVEALGVTDYFCIRTYQNVRRYREAGRLPGVRLLFPNVEIRLDIKTAKVRAVNLHLLFSPDDPNHESEITRILGQLRFDFRERQYACTIQDLVNLGRAFDSMLDSDESALRAGANQFKVGLKDLKDVFRKEEWLRKNCLVAVAGGSNDGTSGLQEDDSFAATRQEIERFADIIFTATPKQRQFWLGQLNSADVSSIERTYRSLKPCLHGSDAHKDISVAAPDLDRFCWLKGDLCFETLRQAVIEPGTRVHIGVAPPTGGLQSWAIDAVQPGSASWVRLQGEALPLNRGLVAIIGARGSGKTALVDFIAAGANSADVPLSESSFLKRASHPSDLLEDASVALHWGAGDVSQCRLIDAVYGNDDSEPQRVCYLSQQFVERLCSSGGLATELRREMERVVFESTDPTDRYEAESFDELASILLDPIRHRRSVFRDAIHETAVRIVEEDSIRERQPLLEKEAGNLQTRIQTAKKDLGDLLPKEKEVHVKNLMAIDQALGVAETKVEFLRRRRKQLDDLAAEARHIRTVAEPDRARRFRERFKEAGLTEVDWRSFGMAFVGDVDSVIQQQCAGVDRLIAIAINGDPKTASAGQAPLNELPLGTLRQRRDEVKKLVGADEERQKKYDDLQKSISKDEATLARLAQQIASGKESTNRRAALIEERRKAYVDVFRTITEEESVLRQLYFPLQGTLAGSTGALSKLKFSIRRRVDLPAWVKLGEELMDLRRESRFRQGALLDVATTELLTHWRSGSAEDVAGSMDAFRTRYQTDLTSTMPASIGTDQKRQWIQQVADWLFSTDHITVEYGIEYDGVAVEQLSPGTRGIVLLLLYLAVDRQDRRPLLVDQPEENLDPHSVFTELVPHFREARKRRQVIIVTHNANLVVNTDADQVVVAESRQTGSGGLPEISYRSGGLENANIRADVCKLLEGGERAFLERERRYRLRWGEALRDHTSEEPASVGSVRAAGT